MHNDPVDFPEPEPTPVSRFEPDPAPAPERIMMEETVVVPQSAAALEQVSASPDVASLDALRSAMVANFEQNDLDVPAFLRKRGEIM
jgi:hypothetical protein